MKESVITFDCYGTLIDWETGIRNAFGKMMRQTQASQGLEERALQIYEEEERLIEHGKPHLLYRQVLSKSALAVSRRIGWTLSEKDSSFLAEDLPNWAPFSDTNPALQHLAKNHTLGILSNVDNDLLAGTLKHLKARFDILVTAENVGSYKPAFAHFEKAHELIGTRNWVHVAGSQFHDIEPAATLGIRAIWVNRKGARLLRNYPEDQVSQVENLTQLADQLGS
ncbi:MAG TPA: HAD-IA family hydrolase [Candidatus Bathyarchaeia archaeon]|nr:HAD-IA family hydrolase [Candidatus Bathyarchaeia archaeon]